MPGCSLLLGVMWDALPGPSGLVPPRRSRSISGIAQHGLSLRGQLGEELGKLGDLGWIVCEG